MRIKCFMMACLLIFGIVCFSGCNKKADTGVSCTEATAAESTYSETTDSGKTIHNVETLSAYYNSIDEVYGFADLIIKGKVVSSSVELMSHSIPLTEEEAKELGFSLDDFGPAQEDVTTIYKIEISEVYKGEAGDTINLLQLGGEYKNEIWIYEDAANIELNKEYVMFMNKSELHENSAWLVNELQSVFSIDGETLIELSPDFGAGYDNLLSFLQSKQS